MQSEGRRSPCISAQSCTNRLHKSRMQRSQLWEVTSTPNTAVGPLLALHAAPRPASVAGTPSPCRRKRLGPRYLAGKREGSWSRVWAQRPLHEAMGSLQQVRAEPGLPLLQNPGSVLRPDGVSNLHWEEKSLGRRRLHLPGQAAQEALVQRQTLG